MSETNLKNIIRNNTNNLKVLKNEAHPIETGGFGEPMFKETAELNFLGLLKNSKDRFFYTHLINPNSDFQLNFGLQLQGALRPIDFIHSFIPYNYYSNFNKQDWVKQNELEEMKSNLLTNYSKTDINIFNEQKLAQYDIMNPGYGMEKDLRSNYGRGYERYDRHVIYTNYP